MTDSSSCARVLSEHATLFWQARTGRIKARYVGPGRTLYDVAETLLCVERELRENDFRRIADCQAAYRDLLNILTQRTDWETAGG